MTQSAGVAQPIVRMVRISKSFTGTDAVRNVDLEFFPGEVHGLVGENGAGKSTLMRVLAGMYPDYSGEIFLNGSARRIHSPRLARELGIAMVHQELSLVPELSVAENMFLGREAKSRIPGFISRRKIEKEAGLVLAEIEADVSPNQRINQLSVAKQQLVEIAKGISMHSQVLILDEPTSSLSEPEIRDLFRVIRTTKEKGVAIIYISHKLAEIFAIADRITVLRDGVRLSSRSVDEWDEEALVREMVGRNLSDFFPRTHRHLQDDPVLEVTDLTQLPHFANVSLRVHRSEVVGIYGLIGSGRTRLAKAIFGLSQPERGQIRIVGRPTEVRTPFRAIENGIALVPEDRRILGLVQVLDVRKNLTLPILRKISNSLFINSQEERRLVRQNIAGLKIRTPSATVPVSSLSGGNQQKVVLGKWLNTNPVVLILDEPTRGIDVGAKAEIRSRIDALAAAGMGILLISSELAEIIGMSDRILVMREKRIAGEFNRHDFSEEAIGSCAIARRQ
ncbi:MAG: sugar ABC transporter ATP-binding protein [Verrucomicrobia bacterium]|nr:sugar ABC transporter ATP-binding protein [Verrucomicrobiota bacterium]